MAVCTTTRCAPLLTCIYPRPGVGLMEILSFQLSLAFLATKRDDHATTTAKCNPPECSRVPPPLPIRSDKPRRETDFSSDRKSSTRSISLSLSAIFVPITSISLVRCSARSPARTLRDLFVLGQVRSASGDFSRRSCNVNF